MKNRLADSREAGNNFRHELKYLCSDAQLVLIEGRIRRICAVDAHAGTSGIYRIRSLYFDDRTDRYLTENENGCDPREKFRIRIYNADIGQIKLECKRKEHGMTQKTSCALTEEQCRAAMAGTMTLTGNEPAVLRKFYLEQKRGLMPKVIVSYERKPFVYRIGNVRITFDRNLESSTRVEDFLEKNVYAVPVLPVGQHILEVKYDALLPDYLREVMQIGSLQETAFSKYYMCRKNTTEEFV